VSFIDLARERFSLRSFAKKPVEKEKLDLILKAAQLAPTACNNQPQKIIVVDDAQAFEKIKQCTRCHFDAPVVLVVCYDSRISWKRGYDGKDSGDIDAAILVTHMTLQAADIVLGSVIVQNFNPEARPRAVFPAGTPHSGASASCRLPGRRRRPEYRAPFSPQASGRHRVV
jgi:nitroreductase